MSNAFLTVVCPLMGNLLGVIMLLSSIPNVLLLRRTRQMGDINPLPYPFTALNCLGWVVYGLVMKDPWISPANIVGCCAGVAFTCVALSVADHKTQDLVLVLMTTAVAYFSILGMVGVFGGLSLKQVQQMWGIQSVLVLMLYYAMPLSSMLKVVRSRNAASIYLPLAAAAIANGTMWSLYGAFGTHDPNLWVPNAFGALLGCVQVGLRLAYGGRPAGAGLAEESTSGRQGPVLVQAHVYGLQGDDKEGDDGELGLHCSGRSGSGMLLLQQAPHPSSAPAEPAALLAPSSIPPALRPVVYSHTVNGHA
ncbi:hypothetical protein V8C86DRAFT_2689310 [Haematococcus lacustris]